jgi:hypothetical protein
LTKVSSPWFCRQLSRSINKLYMVEICQYLWCFNLKSLLVYSYIVYRWPQVHEILIYRPHILWHYSYTTVNKKMGHLPWFGPNLMKKNLIELLNKMYKMFAIVH